MEVFALLADLTCNDFQVSVLWFSLC